MELDVNRAFVASSHVSMGRYLPSFQSWVRILCSNATAEPYAFCDLARANTFKHEALQTKTYPNMSICVQGVMTLICLSNIKRPSAPD